jgi:hypothetical protein
MSISYQCGRSRFIHCDQLLNDANKQGHKDRRNLGQRGRICEIADVPTAPLRRGFCCAIVRTHMTQEPMRPEGTDNNLAAVNLVLIWFCRCLAAPPHRKPTRPAFSLGKTSPPVLPGRLTERKFAAFLGPRNSVTAVTGGFSTLRNAARQGTPTSRKSAGVLGSNHLKLRPIRCSKQDSAGGYQRDY